MDRTIEVIRNRRSIRTYKQESVVRTIMEEIVDCARLAPTAMNVQPWDFVVVTKREDLAKIPLLIGHGEFIARAAFAVLVLARETECAVEDCSAATENLLIAAAAHGLGSCWVAGTKQAYGPAVVSEFGAPARPATDRHRFLRLSGRRTQNGEAAARRSSSLGPVLKNSS